MAGETTKYLGAVVVHSGTLAGRSTFSKHGGSGKRLAAWWITVLVALLALGFAAIPKASAASCNPVPHGPILVRGDSGFTAANGVISGGGTSTDPYLIANLQLNDLTPGYGLKVDNSKGGISKFFNIKCIQSSFTESAPSGSVLIWLVNIHTATTISTSSSNSGRAGGSVAVELDSSSSITLNNLSINKFGADGILLNGSDHITIVNTKSKSSTNGLRVVNSHDLTIGQVCTTASGSGCDELTYDDGRGLFIENSFNIQVLYTITAADDTGGVLLDGSGTYSVTMTNGVASGNGPICPSGTPTGEKVDTIAGIAVTNGAHDINVKGYTINANGDGFGGFFDIMNGGNGGYLNPCNGQITSFKKATPPGGANLDFNGNCYHLEFNFNPVPTTTCT